MKEFMQVLRRFVPPYKKYLVLTVVFNILSAVLNIFSFLAIIPILQIIFQTGVASPAPAPMERKLTNPVCLHQPGYHPRNAAPRRRILPIKR